MARQRMYVFERAYKDFGGRLGGYWQRVWSLSRGLWGWFWDGGGALAIEIGLRIAVVGSAAWAAGAYYRYEASHGRGFSVGMLLLLVVLFAYAVVLLWSWKAPVHWIGKLSSAVSASGLVLALAVAGLAAALGVFVPYLLFLVVLTAVSFVVFIPMRLAHMAWLMYRSIHYKCPYDDCRHRGLPIHVCSCGGQYPDLQPSFYGIFHHKCRHGRVDVKLPTLVGRSKLPRLCGGCKRALLHSSLGELREWPVFVVGGPNAGKSLFITQAIRGLIRHFSSMPNATARLDSDVQQDAFDKQTSLLDRGDILAKTAGEAMHALGLAVRVTKGLRCLLYFFDKPGEYFESMRKFGQLQGLESLRGIVLLVDPFASPELAAQAHWLGSQLRPSETALPKVVDSLINAVDVALLEGRPNQVCTSPLAVVVAKIDAFDSRVRDRFPFLTGLEPASTPAEQERVSQACRAALLKLGEGPSIQKLDLKFSTIRYFPCTALGRMPDVGSRAPFQPRGVIEPFLWLLDASSGTTSRTVRTVENFRRAAL